MVVGWTHAGNFCHVPVTICGASCTALVDTGSTATLMRPDVVPEGTQLEQTAVQLRTVTGELAPMLGRGRATLNVGGQATIDIYIKARQSLFKYGSLLDSLFECCQSGP